ncbi:MAG TPA: class I SAM-dependent methyltransferase [Acidimicrobiales bacterium]|nr:class I SAM-dependent methyltransferase [Acidimicrobiales bacterium]
MPGRLRTGEADPDEREGSPRGGAPGGALASGAAQSTPLFYRAARRWRSGRDTVAVEGYDASTYGDRFAEVYDDWYDGVTDAEACADHVAALARAAAGPVLELGVGSGRLALPLVARGVEVHGIDASAAMLERLRSKPGGDAVQTTLGDMAAIALEDPPAFAVVLVAYNTFFNLADEPAQATCLARVAELLTPQGVLLVEAFVPGDALDGGAGAAAERSVTPRRITADEVVLTVSQVDPVAQTITGQHVHLSEGGIRLRPWHLRYLSPEQLDTLAAGAGLELLQRRAGWSDEPFTAGSDVHVSTYRRTNVRPVPTPAPTPR